MGTPAAGECFHSFFECSQTFTSVSMFLLKHGKSIFYSLKNAGRKRMENHSFISIIKTKICNNLFPCHIYVNSWSLICVYQV